MGGFTLRGGRRALVVAATAVVSMGLTVAPAQAGSIWDGYGPWGPYGFGTQPVLGEPIPPGEPLGKYDNADFDSDGVRNIADNCLLVPNPGQEPAVRRDGAIGPRDMLRLATDWKAANPDARFRTDAELGEACSGYNKNYLRTTRALIHSSDQRKIEIFEFLGQSGPMFGGSPAPMSSDPAPGPGNLATSLPMCSSKEKIAQLPNWILSGFTDPGSGIVDPFVELLPQRFTDCGKTGWIRAIEDSGMYWGWAGKRLYTNEDGGRITNRFVAGLTELPGFDEFADSPLGKLISQGLPMLFPAGTGQTFQGLIFRGKSYIDGNDAIVMDWRGPKAFPANFEFGHNGYLIYDECRAIQTGVYHCTAVVDAVVGENRMTWQEGYMPWVVKGPPSIEEYLAATR
ncbi:thrombospondin type 3 repeat-containing protein [Amycolatopsis aidingensis]|uniref:thrombospondin type 3 repeat-containing protein n=1 Tax=Amycolatopsis aidingensis TaxID=2842453 RepID=UPI001C0E6B99|nr:thrombospondin type 3 repeat-containing protein [Amycolatopsis aidingensis]